VPGDEVVTLVARLVPIKRVDRFLSVAERLLDRPGAALLVIDGDGYACAENGAILLLAARTDAAAADLLWGAMLSGPRGATVDHRFISADNGWAIDAGLEAGLSLTDCGPIFARGDIGPLAPFLPSGPYL